MMQATVLPICAVIPTMDRSAILARTLHSLLAQTCLPSQVVIVDGSADDASRVMLAGAPFQRADIRFEWHKAAERGAAIQRNQGVRASTCPYILFMDDDILFDDDCLARLWHALASNDRMGGVSAMIRNQRYEPPGALSRAIYAILDGGASDSYAGRVIGPAINLLPDDREDLPDVVPVQWLNTTCTLYRRSALPTPPYDSMFSGYSLMEDLTLSLRVARTWQIANARTARMFHDSQPGAHKSDVAHLAEMSVLNRHYVMREVLGRRRLRDYASLLLWEGFQLAALLRSAQSRHTGLEVLRGKMRAFAALVRRGRGAKAGLHA